MNIQPLTKFKILLIGDDCLDIYQFGTVDRISPEAPVPVFQLAHKQERPGMARNVKANLEQLGCDVEYLSGNTSVKTRLIDTRSGQQIVRIDSDATSQPVVVNTHDLPYDAIVISDYNKGAVDYELIESLIKIFPGPVFVDTKKTNLIRLSGAIIKINAKEHAALISQPSANLIVTRGEHGVSWDQVTIPAKPVEVVDVCGAGDTFLAALTYGFLQHGTLVDAICFANSASSITVQHMGCYAPTLEEIQ